MYIHTCDAVDIGGEKRERDGERDREVILLIKEVCEGQCVCGGCKQKEPHTF